MKSRLFRRKKRADLDYVYWSIGEGLDAESQLANDKIIADAPTPPTPNTNTRDKSPAIPKTTIKSDSNNEVKGNEAKVGPNALVDSELEPPASRLKSLRRNKGTPFIPSFLHLGGPPPRADSPCSDVDANDGYCTSFSPIEGRDDILIPHLNEVGENNSNIGSSSTPQRRLPLLVKKNRYDRGGLLSNPVHTHMNEDEVNGMEAPAALATRLQKRNLRTSRNWSDEPPAPHRWHQVRDTDEDTEEDREENRDDFDDDDLGPDPLVDDLCNQSRPVGCISIAVTAGIAALWLL